MAYRILYFSDHRNQWLEYVAPAWGAKPIRHERREDALERLEHLQSQWPRDKFMLEGE